MKVNIVWEVDDIVAGAQIIENGKSISTIVQYVPDRTWFLVNTSGMIYRMFETQKELADLFNEHGTIRPYGSFEYILKNALEKTNGT